MTTTTEYALMAGHVYRTTRDEINWLPAPQGWTPYFPVPDPTTATGFPVTSGFEAIAFQRGSEIVVSYAGTYDKDLGGDQLANAGLATGVGSAQLLQAVEYYLQVKAANPGATITLTGHSLGGGLAALVGVFFGVPAQTFDQAPFAKTAWLKAPDVMAYLSSQKDASGNRLYSSDALAPLASYIEQKSALGAAPTFIPNAALISNINVQGEFLSSAPWTVYDRIGTTTQTITDSAPGVSGFNLHAQALLTAYLQSDLTAPSGQALNEVTATLPQLLGMIFDSQLYSFRTDDASNRNFLDHLVRHEAGGIGGIAPGGDAMLTHFAADLNKLGTNLAGLNTAAQNALIAQGIEWYYWQGSDYAGQEFFANGSQAGLLQYTTAQGAGLDAAQNKAASYVKAWLDPIADAHGAFGVATTYAQWSVTTGSAAVTASAQDLGKNQIFIGGSGADTFTGGDQSDLLFGGGGVDTLTGGGGADQLYGGAGNDTLDGGEGSDRLYGGAGTDKYQFTGNFGKDIIQDSDGLGSIVLNGNPLATAKGAGERDTWKDSNGVRYKFNRQESDTLGTLVISTDNAGDAINIKNFDLTKGESGGYLGIKLDATQKIALIQGTGKTAGAATTNPYSDKDFNETSLAGKSGSVNEGNGKAFNLYLAQGAQAGDTVTLALEGDLAAKFKADLGDSSVDANGAVITLVEGQSVVSFSLINDSQITEDLMGSLKASYHSADAANGQTAVESNSYAISLKDAGAVTHTYNGDQRAPLNASGNYDWGATTWLEDGTLSGGVAEAGFADVITGTAGNDKIAGLGGNDALDGGAGNDEIDGGAGDDLIGGGAGSDNIKGGDGNDTILGATTLTAAQRSKLTDHFTVPVGATVGTSGPTWANFRPVNAREGVGFTIGGGGSLSMDDAPDVIDAGDGDDEVIGGRAMTPSVAERAMTTFLATKATTSSKAETAMML